MRRIMTSVALALAVALAPARPAPAQAIDSDELVGLLIGLGAIYAIGKAIEDGNGTQRTSTKAKPQKIKPEKVKPWAGSASSHRVVPQGCLVAYSTRNGPVRGYGKQCLRNKVSRPGLLPARCELRIRTQGGPRTLYVPWCLREAGWRTAEVRQGRSHGGSWRGQW